MDSGRIMGMKARSVVVAAVVALLMVDSAAALPATWWDNSYHYRINVTVNTSIYNRTYWPIVYPINFSDYPLQGAFDNNSVRVIEYNPIFTWEEAENGSLNGAIIQTNASASENKIVLLDAQGESDTVQVNTSREGGHRLWLRAANNNDTNASQLNYSVNSGPEKNITIDDTTFSWYDLGFVQLQTGTNDINISINPINLTAGEWGNVSFDALIVTTDFWFTPTGTINPKDNYTNFHREVTSQFDKKDDYENSTNAAGEVVWLMGGSVAENTILQYYIYFDSADFGIKPDPNYPSNINFTNFTSKFEVNTSNLSVKVDTSRGNLTSGMYFAQFKDDMAKIFDETSGGRTLEYIRYKNSSNDYLGFNFNENFEVEHAGPVRITIKQKGDEVVWGTTSSTNEGNMTKSYTFYENNTWLQISQTYYSLASQSRYSGLVDALRLDIGRTEIGGNGDYNGSNKQAPTAYEPLNWASAYEDTGGGNLGIGIINLNQSASTGVTPSYRSKEDGGNSRIGVGIDSLMDSSSNWSASETAIVYFHKEKSHDPVRELRRRFMNDTYISQNTVELREVAFDPNTTNFKVYNHNETVYIVGNITKDNYNLSSTVNATLTDPNGKEVNLTLTKNGSVFNASYFITPENQTGVWNLTIRAYDNNQYLLNTSVSTFNVTDIYTVEIGIRYNPAIVNTTNWANITVKTSRNDTGITGIQWPDISCAYYNITNTSEVVDLPSSNISEGVFGNYSSWWHSPYQGDWNFTCNVTVVNNTGNATVTFTDIESETTTLDLTLNTTIQWETPPNNVSFVKWNTNQTFVASLNVTNIEEGFGFDANVTFYFNDSSWNPASLWVSNDTGNTNIFNLGEFNLNRVKIVDFEITVPNRTTKGLYYVSANLTWRNGNGTHNSTLAVFNITVKSNPVLETIQPVINLSVSENSAPELNFTIFSAGNDHLGFINYSCTSNASAVCSNFTPVFSPVNISSLDKGSLQNVTMTFTIPNGQPPGNHIGNVTVYSGNQSLNVTINLTVSESRNWTVNETACFRAALPNRTGDACEVVIENTGNVELNFTVTPAYNSTNHTNYSYPDLPNLPNLTVPANTSKTILFKYNTTTISTNQTNITVYTINATDQLADPDYNTTTVTIDTVYGPDILFWNVSNEPKIPQLNDTIINVTIEDRLRLGNYTWVRANITLPDNTTVTVNLTNDTALTPGAVSDWSYKDNEWIKQRGTNYSVVVFAGDDLVGGFANSTTNKTFTVYAKLKISINPTPYSIWQGTSGRFKMFINDSIDAPLEDVNITVEIYAPLPDFWGPISYQTNENGTVYSTTYTIGSGDDLGQWNWRATVGYYDAITGENINESVSGVFVVIKSGAAYTVSVSTGNLYYPGDNVTIISAAYESGSIITEYQKINITVNITDESGNVIDIFNLTRYPADVYKGVLELPIDTTPGTYFVKATLYYADILPDTRSQSTIFDVQPFSPDLNLEIEVEEAYNPGDVISVTAFVSDKNSYNYSDANVTLKLTIPNGPEISLNVTSVNSTSPPKFTANYTLPNDATLGEYMLYGEARYNNAFDSAVAQFVVSEKLFTQIAMDPVVYLNKTMNLTVTIINPMTQQGIEPDNMTLTFYNTTGGIIEKWKTLIKSDFVNGTNPGVFTYSEIVDVNVTTGTYSAILEVREGNYRVWGMTTFKVQEPIDFDLTILEWIREIPRNGAQKFKVNATNMGDFVPGEDLEIHYWIDPDYYKRDWIPRKFEYKGHTFIEDLEISNIELPIGDHQLIVAVFTKDGRQIADTSKTFKIGAGGDGGGPSGGGGGGGAPEEEEGIPKLSIVEFYPQEVHIERGGVTYLVATVENLGGTDLHDISAEITGIPEEWFEVIKGDVELLESNESSDILFQIKVPENVAAQVVTLTVTANSTESLHQRSLIMRIFSSRGDLVYFEIESVKKTMRNSEDRALRALNEGKNVSEVMTKIDEARMEIRSAENYLSSSEYEKALGRLDNARGVLEHVNELLEFLRLEEGPAPPPVVIPAPGLGISTPILIFMFFVIAALGGMVVFLAREQITGALGSVTAAPTVKKARAKRASPEVLSQANDLRAEITNTERLLGTMKGQHEAGLISDSTHKELKNRNDEKIQVAKSQLKKLGV